MTDARRQEIRKLADVVGKAMQARVPVDIDELVKKLGGTIDEIPLLSVEARVSKTGPAAFTIALRPGASERRRRFSVAHELGHVFLHMGYLIDPPKWESMTVFEDSMARKGYSITEFEAHEFAGALLMPEEEFREEALKHFHAGSYSIVPIADRFKVSRDAATNRGRWLGIFSWS